jgi:hypothetical protein
MLSVCACRELDYHTISDTQLVNRPRLYRKSLCPAVDSPILAARTAMGPVHEETRREPHYLGPPQRNSDGLDLGACCAVRCNRRRLVPLRRMSDDNSTTQVTWMRSPSISKTGAIRCSN